MSRASEFVVYARGSRGSTTEGEETQYASFRSVTDAREWCLLKSRGCSVVFVLRHDKGDFKPYVFFRGCEVAVK